MNLKILQKDFKETTFEGCLWGRDKIIYDLGMAWFRYHFIFREFLNCVSFS